MCLALFGFIWYLFLLAAFPLLYSLFLLGLTILSSGDCDTAGQFIMRAVNK